MRAKGNGRPEVCATNLLKITRGEVSYDRIRGRDGALIDQPNATDEAVADAEWVLETFEPRVNTKDIQINPEAGNPGNFNTYVDIERKEDEDA